MGTFFPSLSQIRKCYSMRDHARGGGARRHASLKGKVTFTILLWKSSEMVSKDEPTRSCSHAPVYACPGSLFGFGGHSLAILRGYSACQELLLAALRESDGMLGIEFGSAACKTSALPTARGC